MFYLKKVIAIIENSLYRKAIEKLGQSLKQQGMEVLCFFVEDMGLSAVTAERVLDSAWQAVKISEAMDVEEMYIEEIDEYDIEGVEKESSGYDVEEDKNYEVAEIDKGKETLCKSNGKCKAFKKKVSCLWMTDMSEMVSVLRHLNYPVLALLHEENRSQDFSAASYACEDPENLDARYMDRVYRRYKRLPWDIMETERCLIRETTVEDVDAFYEIYSEPSITLYTEGLFAEPEQEEKYINDYIDCVYSFYNLGVWTILKKDTNEIIGRAGLSYRDGYEEPELGFVIGCPWQRKGYAEEVCRAILEYGREEFEFTEVQAFVRTENKASLALCRKLDMQPAREVEISGEKHLCMKIDFYASCVY